MRNIFYQYLYKSINNNDDDDDNNNNNRFILVSLASLRFTSTYYKRPNYGQDNYWKYEYDNWYSAAGEQNPFESQAG